MADLPLIKQQKQQKSHGMPRGRPFAKGTSGNPVGRPRGCRDKSNRAAESLFDSQSLALSGKAIEMALDGDASVMRLCLDRTVAPRRERAVRFTMPPIRGAADLAAAAGALAGATARGEITPSEAAQLCQLIETVVRASETTDFDRRLSAIEATPAASGWAPYITAGRRSG